MFEYLPKWERSKQKFPDGVVATPKPEVADDGSLFKVPFTTILKVENHPNADRLEIAFVYGFQVIVQKGKYSAGNRVVYIPIDSILPQWLKDTQYFRRIVR